MINVAYSEIKLLFENLFIFSFMAGVAMPIFVLFRLASGHYIFSNRVNRKSANVFLRLGYPRVWQQPVTFPSFQTTKCDLYLTSGRK